MTTVSLSLVSHTNIGKTTLARTLLGLEVGEVRDAPHVTEFADEHELVRSAAGDSLRLWDTPGFGDSARLAQRLRGSSNPLGWLLSQVWDRWRDRPFWASQQAMRHVQAQSDVVLYLVNAAESPALAAYVAAEMELLAWVGKPVLVLLNQLGEPRAPEVEAADVELWRSHLAAWPLVKVVLPMDAFARCWVHELTLMQALQSVLQGPVAQAMARLVEAWQSRRLATFDAAVDELAQSLAQMALTRQPVAEAASLMDSFKHKLKGLGGSLSGRVDTTSPQAMAAQALTLLLQAQTQDSTARLVALHGLEAGKTSKPDGGQDASTEAQILQRVADQFAVQQPVPEGKAALVGGTVAGALAGLKADIASGGLTLGGGMLAGALLGALGAAGVARGINIVRGSSGAPWLRVSDEAMTPLVQAALLRYLAVAHFGRGRGEWVQGEAPAHWPPTVAAAMQAQQTAMQTLWQQRSTQNHAEVMISRRDEARREQQADLQVDRERHLITAALKPLLKAVLEDVLQRLYPSHPTPHPVTSGDNAPP